MSVVSSLAAALLLTSVHAFPNALPEGGLLKRQSGYPSGVASSPSTSATGFSYDPISSSYAPSSSPSSPPVSNPPTSTPPTSTSFGPVVATNFADPSIMQGPDGMYYAYATQSYGKQIQVASSPDGFTWTYLDVDAFAGVSVAWSVSPPFVWAPDVQYINGQYSMYFCATSSSNTALHCIGHATSSSPTGPFIPDSDEPWVCDLDEGGDIDPDQFMDTDGTRYVVYKVDGNSINYSGGTPIMLQQVEDDGVTKVGDPIELINRDAADGPLVEAPSLATSGGTYYLTFSSNNFKSSFYDTSFATASSVTGPYTKIQAPNAPILVTGDHNLYGPGGADQLIVGDSALMAWHGWNTTDLTDPTAARYMYISNVAYNGDEITIDWN